MKYMLLFIRDEEKVLDEDALVAQHADVNRWFGELGPQGKLLGGEELQPSRTATTIRRQEGRPLVTDGPFMESKENVAGFVIINVADLDEAIGIAKTWPLDQPVEIRPIIPHDDDMPNHPVG